MRIKPSIKHLLSATSLLLLSACVGGGGGNDTPESTQNTPAKLNTSEQASPYLFYTGGLHAIDPSAPNSIHTITHATVSGAVLAPSAEVNAETGIFSNIHGAAVVYIENGGIHLASSDISNALAVQQISSESNATTVCGTHIENASHMQDSYYFYRLPGEDNSCDTIDDAWRAVTLGMDSNTSPIEAKNPITVINDASTLTFTHWLVAEGGKILLMSMDFSSSSEIGSYTSSVSYLDSKRGSTLLKIDSTLHIYNQAQNTLTPVLHLMGAIAPSVHSDANFYYVIDRGIFYRLPTDGSQGPKALATLPNNTLAPGITITNKHIFYSWQELPPNNKIVIRRFDPVTLSTTEVLSLPNENLHSLLATGDHLFINSGPGSAPIARIVNEQGVILQEFHNAMWSGVSLPTSMSLDHAYSPDTHILSMGSQINGSFSLSGGSIYSYDGETAQLEASIGNIPPDISALMMIGVGQHMLAMGISTHAPHQRDVFYLNTRLDNSLYRLTNTPDNDEAPVMFVTN